MVAFAGLFQARSCRQRILRLRGQSLAARESWPQCQNARRFKPKMTAASLVAAAATPQQRRRAHGIIFPYGRADLSRSQRHDAPGARSGRSHARLLCGAGNEPGQPARIRPPRSAEARGGPGANRRAARRGLVRWMRTALSSPAAAPKRTIWRVFGLGEASLGGTAGRAIAPPHFIVSAIEHPSILAAADELARRGWRVDRLGVDSRGVIGVAQLDELLTPETRFIAAMLGQNETGVLQPVAEIAALCAARCRLSHRCGPGRWQNSGRFSRPRRNDAERCRTQI